MKRLSVNHIKQMHRLIIAETGGSSGVRSEELLDSAVNLPFQTFDGVPLYKTVESKAAILGYSLIKNHPFIDGNKRTAMMTMLLFLELNGARRDCTDEEIISIGLALADGSMDQKSLLNWILG
ncbi:MAG TPA: type II toxin-antitoxin system death-on-curing family toxin [Clostridiales bacterium]|jgi:death-on-curing protein|nr:type II toxin-antitoxin system death-on-curing family toxin [Clostridiales bacterium]